MMQKISNWKNFTFNLFIFFIPFSVFLGVILFYIYKTETETGRKIIWSQELSKVKIQEQIISKDFREIVSELRVISNLHELNNIIENMGYNVESIINDLYYLSMHKGLYDQIRYLDQTGMEIIRINHNKGKPVSIPKNKLQSKAKRYYFEDTIKLNKGEIFISPLDLNIEHGKIEQPLKPMIRFGTPVFNQNGDKRGIVLLNYYAGIMISNLERVVSQGFGQFSFLNSEGYWLKGSDRTNEWGFMYKDRKEMTFGNKFPSEWKEIRSSDSDQIYSKNGLFTFTTFYPLKGAQKSSTGSGEAFRSSTAIVEGKDYFFKLVSHIPNSLLLETSQRVFKKLFQLYIAINGILIMGAVTFAYFIENRRRASEERKKLIQELRQALNEVKTLQGIIPICSYCKKIRDEKGMWNMLEAYIHSRSEAEFSHGICPECYKKQMKDL
jgi:hypothetical protein